jgi:glycosyltransferase involved in cell wall biosynthesis
MTGALDRTTQDAAIEVAKLGDIAAGAGLHRVSMLAWRDLDDPEAGGSELHASNIAKHWAEAGIEVNIRTSYAAGHSQVTWRDGYRVIRKAGRYLVFPRAAFSEMMGWHGGRDGLVEIWNGMPFFSPLWSRTAHVTWLHHVHAEMWQMTLPPRLAALGNFVESKIAPPIYHRTSMVTPSESSKREMVQDLGFRPDRVSVVPPGIDPHYRPGGEKSPTPLVVAVGRLVPVKQFDVLIDALLPLKAHHPDLEAVIIGEGYTREELEAQIHAARAESWIHLLGRVDEDTKVEYYQRAWVLSSASIREGWGMTITEAAACGTPAVVSDIAGHADAVVDGETGILCRGRDALTAGLDRLLRDGELRTRMSEAARVRAGFFSWEATARGTLEILAAAAIARRGPRR